MRVINKISFIEQSSSLHFLVYSLLRVSRNKKMQSLLGDGKLR